MKLKSFQDLNPTQFPDKELRVQQVDKRLSQYQAERWLTPSQHMLYSVAMGGLTALSPEQERVLDSKARREIVLLSNRAKKLLNAYKQQVMTSSIAVLLNKLFPNAPATNGLSLLCFQVKDYEFEPEISFKSLGITRGQIIAKLMEWEILPKTFYQTA